MNEKVDIIIPTYKPGQEFEELIRRLGKQSYPIHQIFVINTKSGSFPNELCEKANISVTHIRKEDFNHGGTRDYAFGKSDADIVVFMTQDAMPANKRLIENLVKAFEQEDVGAAYARQLPAKDCGVIECYTREFNYPKESIIKGKKDLPYMGIKTFFCSNVCAAYSRAAYYESGGFEKHTIFNEDMILAGKMVNMGYKISYAAEAEVIHSHNYSGVQQFHRNFDLAVSQAGHPEVFEGIPSEGEGIKLVKQTAMHLLKTKKAYLIPELIYKSGCKYIGYKLGKNYQKLPQWIVQKCTMDTTYWAK